MEVAQDLFYTRNKASLPRGGGGRVKTPSLRSAPPKGCVFVGTEIVLKPTGFLSLS